MEQLKELEKAVTKRVKNLINQQELEPV